MILIIGSNHDDVLYYESLLTNPEEVVILDKYHALLVALPTKKQWFFKMFIQALFHQCF